MTVKHLENMQRQQVAMTAATDPQVLNKFRAGFSECAGEVGRFPGLEPPVRRRLLQHLANVLNTSTGTEGGNLVNINNNSSNNNNSVSIQTGGQNVTSGTPTVQSAGVQVHILPASDAPQSGILFSTTTTGGGLQLVPTRLPNGDIALVLPSTNASRQLSTPSPNSQMNPTTRTSISTSPLPMLIPIPSRTSSTASSQSSIASETSTVSSASQTTTISTSTNTSTSPISFDRLTVSTTPSPQPQSPPLINQQISPSQHHPQHLPQQQPQSYHQNIQHSSLMFRNSPEHGIGLRNSPDQSIILRNSPDQGIVLRNSPEQGVALRNSPEQGIILRTSPEQGIVMRNSEPGRHYSPVDTNQVPVLAPPALIPLHQNQLPRNYLPQTQPDAKPLSLVMKKKHPEVVVEEDRPWRPW